MTPHSLQKTLATEAPVNPEIALTMLGPSAATAHLWLKVRRLAPHVRTVLLTGAPDCGQYAVARLLLDLSPAPKRSLVQLTAADANVRLNDRSGLALLPADAFLFIPDIDHYSPSAAETLLRIMRMRRSRLFTVVAVATKNLHALTAAGSFPKELAQLLTCVSFALPELKQRLEDIPLLLRHLLAPGTPVTGSAIPTFTNDFLRAAMEYTWPGNFQELARVANLLGKLVRDGRELTASDFASVVASKPAPPIMTTPAVRLVALETVVQEHVTSVLHGCGGNKLRAAEVLGVSRSTLYRMLNSAVSHDGELLGLAT